MLTFDLTGNEGWEAVCDSELVERLSEEESYAATMEGATLSCSVVPSSTPTMQRSGQGSNEIIFSFSYSDNKNNSVLM